jgi:hypothetical protein
VATPEPVLPELRASDAERTAVVDRLQAAMAEGRISVEEFTERSAAAHAARTVGDLAPLTRDLPETGGHSRAVPDLVAERAAPVVAVFGGAVRKGRWTPARQETAVAVFGGVELDYRDAALPAGTSQLRAFAVFGGVDVAVPEGVRVEMTGFAVFGGREARGDDAAAPGAPVLRVHAVAVFGGVSVTTKRRR